LVKLRLPLAIFALALTPLAAPLVARTHPLAALLIRDFFSRLCHQDPTRSFLVEGSPVAVCVRCLGIYGGAALATLQRVEKLIAARLFAIAILLNLIDIATASLHLHGNLPLPRFLLGLFLGLATGLVLFSPAERTV
jgi:uncharacterized membrane protein